MLGMGCRREISWYRRVTTGCNSVSTLTSVTQWRFFSVLVILFLCSTNFTGCEANSDNLHRKENSTLEPNLGSTAEYQQDLNDTESLYQADLQNAATDILKLHHSNAFSNINYEHVYHGTDLQCYIKAFAMHMQEGFVVDAVDTIDVGIEMGNVWLWRNFHHLGSTYVVGIEINRIFIWQVKLDGKLQHASSIWIPASATIIDAAPFYILSGNKKETMLAVLVHKGYLQLDLYKVQNRGQAVHFVAVIVEALHPDRIHIAQGHEQVLLLLVDGHLPHKNLIVYEPHSEGISKLEVEHGQDQGPVSDIECFSVHEKIFCVFARDGSDTEVTVVQMKSCLKPHCIELVEVQRLAVPYVVDVHHFTVRNKLLVAFVTRYGQDVFLWNENYLLEHQHHMSEIFHAMEWHAVSVSNCRDDKLLLLLHGTEDGPTVFSLFSVNWKLSSDLVQKMTLQRVENDLCMLWRPLLQSAPGKYSEKEFLSLNDAKRACVLDGPQCQSVVEASPGSFHLSSFGHNVVPQMGTTTYLKTVQDGLSCYLNRTSVMKPGSLTSYLVGDQPILLVSNNAGIRAFTFYYHFVETSDPIKMQMEHIDRLIEQLQEDVVTGIGKLQVLYTRVSLLLESETPTLRPRNNLPRTPPPPAGHGPPDVVRVNDTRRDQKLRLQMNQILSQVEDLEQRIVLMGHMLEDIVLKDQPEHIKSIVVHGQIKAPLVMVGDNIKIETVGSGKDVARVFDSIARRHPDLPETLLVSGNVTFNGHVRIQKDVAVGCCVNQERVANWLTTHTEQEVVGTVSFVGGLGIHAINGLQRINDVAIAQIVPLALDNYILGVKNFTEIVYGESASVGRFVDTLDLVEWTDKVLYASGEQTVTSRKVLVGRLKVQNELMVQEYVNGVPLPVLSRSVVRTDYPAEIVGRKVFVDDLKLVRLSVGGLVGRLSIPFDLFASCCIQAVLAPKEFKHASFGDVAVVGMVDGLHLPQDVVTLTRPEDVEHVSFLSGINVEADVYPGGMVDNVYLANLLGILEEMETHKTQGMINGPVIVRKNLEFRGLINGVDLKALAKDSVYRDETEVSISAGKRFNHTRLARLSLLGKINDHSLLDFMTLDTNQNLGVVAFLHPVVFLHNLISPVVDTVPARDFRALKMMLNPTEQFNMMYDVHLTDSLKVSGYIDHINISRAVLHSRMQAIPGRKTFLHDLYADMAVVADMALDATVDEVDIAELVDRRVTLRSDQEISSDAILGSNAARSIAVDGVVNDMTLNTYPGYVMSCTKPQTLTGSLKIDLAMAYADIKVNKDVNGVDLHELNNMAVKLHENSRVSEKITFDVPVFVTRLNVDDTINGVDLVELQSDSAKKNAASTFLSQTAFRYGFHVARHVSLGRLFAKASGYPQKAVFSDTDGWNVLLKGRDQAVSGNLHLENTYVRENVTGVKVNSIDLAKLASSVAYMHRRNVVRGNLKFQHLTAVRVLAVKPTGVYRGVSSMETLKAIAKLCTADTRNKDKKQEVPPMDLVWTGPVTVDGDIDCFAVNDEIWIEFAEDIVWRRGYQQVVDAPKSLWHAVFVGNVTAETAGVDGFVSHIHLPILLESAVHLNEEAEIEGRKAFSGNMKIKELLSRVVNGISMPRDVITIHTPQTVFGRKTFAHVETEGPISVRDRVNSLVLPYEAKITLLRDADQVIPSKLKLMGTTTFVKHVHTPTVNGRNMSNVVLIDKNEDIANYPVFKSGITLEKNLAVRGMISEVDLMELTSEVVYLDGRQDIEAQFSFVGPLQLGFEAVCGLQKDVCYGSSLEPMHEDVADHAVVLRYLEEQAKGCFLTIDYFVHVLDLDIAARRMQSFVALNSVVLLSWAYTQPNLSCIFTHIYSLRPTGEVVEFELPQEDKLWFVSHWNGRTLFISSDQYSLCSKEKFPWKEPAAVAVYDYDSMASEMHLMSTILGTVARDLAVIGDLDVPLLVLLRWEGVVTTHSLELERAIFRQKLPIRNAVSLLSFRRDYSWWIAIGTLNSVFIFEEVNNTLALTQRLDESGHVLSHFSHNGQHFLVSSEIAGNSPCGSVHIFHSGSVEEEFLPWQSVATDMIRHLATFTWGTPPTVYLAVLQSPASMSHDPESMLIIYSMTSEAKFEQSLTVVEGQGVHIHPFNVGNDLYIGISEASSLLKSKIYKAVTTGCKTNAYPLEIL